MNISTDVGKGCFILVKGEKIRIIQQGGCDEKVSNSNIDKNCFTKWNCARKSYWFQEKNKGGRKVLKKLLRIVAQRFLVAIRGVGGGGSSLMTQWISLRRRDKGKEVF